MSKEFFVLKDNKLDRGGFDYAADALTYALEQSKKYPSYYFTIDESKENEESENNGGKTDYYQLESSPFPICDFDDFAEWRKMNGNQFNIGKVAWTFNAGRHSGTDYERDLNKIIHYAKRELMRLRR